MSGIRLRPCGILLHPMNRSELDSDGETKAQRCFDSSQGMSTDQNKVLHQDMQISRASSVFGSRQI